MKNAPVPVIIEKNERTPSGAEVHAMEWVDDFKISVRIDGGTATVSANRAGLISLANHLTALAEQAPGNHIHLDAYNALEEGSAELILDRIE